VVGYESSNKKEEITVAKTGIRMTELRRIRRAQDLTQEELAKKAGVSLRVVNDAERGEFMPRAQNLIKIANALGVGVEDILPKASASESDYVNEAGGVSQFRTAGSYVGPITGSSHARVEVDAETLRAALHGVEAGLLTAEEAEERLLAGVA
jgi:transcriptional regulator with XRE-family HTH domain